MCSHYQTLQIPFVTLIISQFVVEFKVIVVYKFNLRFIFGSYFNNITHLICRCK